MVLKTLIPPLHYHVANGLRFGATGFESCLFISWKLKFPNPGVLVVRDGTFPVAALNLPGLLFSREVGMLMHPAPHHQPPPWACVGRLFFLSFVLFPLPILVDLGQDVLCVCVCALPGGRLELAGRGAPHSHHSTWACCPLRCGPLRAHDLVSADHCQAWK